MFNNIIQEAMVEVDEDNNETTDFYEFLVLVDKIDKSTGNDFHFLSFSLLPNKLENLVSYKILWKMIIRNQYYDLVYMY